ncbi:putative metallo-dependent phosphatase [Helianthus annuus]|nr:putative metallo-dependent phosphatase [Helianthus annuus]
MNSNDFCKTIPNLVSSFIDTFVDFTVAGIFLSDPPSPPFSQTTYPPPDRLIAVGNLHGDLSKTQQALRLVGLIDAGDRWSGSGATLVQVGDVLDRGVKNLKSFTLRNLNDKRLKIITMNGNHEILKC